MDIGTSVLSRAGQRPGGWTRMLFSHAQNTLAWDGLAFTEILMTQPMMVVIGGKVGAFGAYRDGAEAYQSRVIRR